MTTAAIYARKSTEQSGIADEEKSVARQIDHAKAYARKKGWTVSPEHIFSDDGISGAEFVKRPGFLRLMAALKPRPPFDVLIMSEESRLGRELIQTGYALQQILDAGVHVFYYLEDRERTLGNATDKVVMAMIHFGAELEREKASLRTHDAMIRKARAGHAVGGKIYGYDNVDVPGTPGPDGKARRQYVIRQINEAEAATVRRIFEGYAAGIGLTRLAKTLNTKAVPPPRGGTLGWAPTAIREIIHRELYAGIMVWNRTQSIQRGGTKTRRTRPTEEWLRVEAPELRIIPPDLWRAVQVRVKKNAAAYLRTASGQIVGQKSGGDRRSKYLLSGIARCGTCGGSLAVFNRSKGRHRRLVYGCLYYHKRGTAVCTNGTQIDMKLLDSALLHALREVLDERVVEVAVERALKQIREEQALLPDQELALTRKLSLIQKRLKGLVNTIADGFGSKTIYEEVHALEAEKDWTIGQLDELHLLRSLTLLDMERIVRTLREKLRELQPMLAENIPETRHLIATLIDGGVICQPTIAAGRSGYDFAATGTYGGLLQGSNDGGGGHDSRPQLETRLASHLTFQIRGRALAA